MKYHCTISKMLTVDAPTILEAKELFFTQVERPGIWEGWDVVIYADEAELDENMPFGKFETTEITGTVAQIKDM